MATLTFIFDPYSPDSVAAAPTVVELWRAHHTGLHFETVHAGHATARLGTGPDSERSARAFSALRAAAPQLELPLMHELHQALGARGERLGRRVLSEIAQRLTFDPAKVFEALRHPDRRERARAELERGRALQLGSGPALLFEHDHIVTSIPLNAGPLAPLIAPLVTT